MATKQTVKSKEKAYIWGQFNKDGSFNWMQNQEKPMTEAEFIQDCIDNDGNIDPKQEYFRLDLEKAEIVKLETKITIVK